MTSPPETPRSSVRVRPVPPPSHGVMPSRPPVWNYLFPFFLSLDSSQTAALDGAPRIRKKGRGIMTLDEIKTSTKLFLTPADVAPVLGSDPHTVRCTARQRPDLLGFEFAFTGNRMKIPRIPFLRWLGEIV